LLALQRGALSQAEEWLQPVAAEFPAARYAWALWLDRSGRTAEARALLGGLDAPSGSLHSPYHAACARLRAALDEREGDLAAAAAAYENHLTSRPDDLVAEARRVRVALRRAYVDSQPLEASVAASLHVLTQGSCAQAGGALEWLVPYAALHALREAAPDSSEEVREQAACLCSRGAGGAQLVTRRLLEAGRANEAWALTEAPGSPPDWRRRTRLILDAWHLLTVGARSVGVNPTRAGKAAVLAELRDCAAAMAALGAQDPAFGHWHSLVRSAVAVAEAQTGELDPDLWTDLTPWPLAQLPVLWASTDEERLRAAEAFVDHGSGDGLPAQLCALVTAIAASALGHDDAFLAAYAALEPFLDELPVAGPELWLRAAAIWLRRKDWGPLLESDLPDCVADFSDPRARLVTGLAYAHAAAEDIGKQRMRPALDKVRRARTNLEPVLPAREDE